jgi:hypothetical protein
MMSQSYLYLFNLLLIMYSLANAQLSGQYAKIHGDRYTVHMSEIMT